MLKFLTGTRNLHKGDTFSTGTSFWYQRFIYSRILFCASFWYQKKNFCKKAWHMLQKVAQVSGTFFKVSGTRNLNVCHFYYSHTLYGASELRMGGGATANPDDMKWNDMIMLMCIHASLHNTNRHNKKINHPTIICSAILTCTWQLAKVQLKWRSFLNKLCW